jgi:large subunit ribosomal protein L30
MKKIKITQVKSVICAKQPHRATVKALGLKRVNHSVIKELTPQIAGMVAAAGYLLKVEELD